MGVEGDGSARASFPRIAAFSALVITALVLALYGLAALVAALLRLPGDLSLPWPVRAGGAALIAGGFAMLAWLFRHRHPVEVVTSSHATLRKLFLGGDVAAPRGRTEPLVVVGPYRVVRHPMYSGLTLIVLGIGLATDRTWALLGALFLFLWFALVIAPFEERELRALFGSAYEAYARRTPRFLPRPWRRRHDA